MKNRKTIKMNYTEQSIIARTLALAQGVTPEQFDGHETWYYDETDNVKHLVLMPSKKVNAGENTCFVLGGIQAEDVITDCELHTALGKASGKELKANKDLKGCFDEILRKDTLKKMLELIDIRGWNVHFMMVQVWYYGFVDIIDSINDNENLVLPLKAILYKILKKYPDDTVNLLGTYHYPNIAYKDRIPFLDGLVSIAVKFLKSKPYIMDFGMTLILIDCFIKAKKRKELTFIQNEKSDEWVKWFDQFYKAEIVSYPNKTLILDTEKQVEKKIKEDPIEIDGKNLTNYRFEDSANPMIQVCDYVVSIIRKYAIFIDRSLCDVMADISKFDATQWDNFRLLNKILKRSLDKSPLYFNYTTSIEMQYNINQLMETYGV